MLPDWLLALTFLHWQKQIFEDSLILVNLNYNIASG